MELIFEVRDVEEGDYCARALGNGIFTEAETWDELRANVLEATSVHFEDGPVHPRLVQLHYMKDEFIPAEPVWDRCLFTASAAHAASEADNIEKSMTVDERIEFLMQSIESHDRQIGELTDKIGEIGDKLDKLGDKVTDAVAKLVRVTNEDATSIRTLARIAEAHE